MYPVFGFQLRTRVGSAQTAFYLVSAQTAVIDFLLRCPDGLAFPSCVCLLDPMSSYTITRLLEHGDGSIFELSLSPGLQFSGFLCV
jgi:hypothetical protein